MRKLRVIFCLVLVVSLFTLTFADQSNFFAYYTRVNHPGTDYMGKYQDIVVNINEDMQLEFTRNTGYRPRLITPEGSYLVDDLYSDRDQDSRFKYNWVRLIKDTEEEIIVHWRYFPYFQELEAENETNPTKLEGLTGVVHEMFKIHPDGQVIREIKAGQGSKYHEWKNSQYKKTQTLTLTTTGINHGAISDGIDVPREIIDGNPIKEFNNYDPVFYCSFDEGMENQEDKIEEKVSDELDVISGPSAIFKAGVSGTAVAFDGYYTSLEYSADSAQLNDEMTINAWLALDAYPYNDAPIIHRSTEFGEEGFYLGVDASGHLLLRLNGNIIKSDEELPLWQWASVTATVGDGKMKIYINNQEVATDEYSGNIESPDQSVMVGYNNEKERCTDPVRGEPMNLKYYYGLQGLIDEVRIFDTKLANNDLTDLYTNFEPSDLNTSLAKGVLPGHNGSADEFGASYKTTELSEIWESMFRLSDYSDVVVKFEDNPGSVIFWHGTNYAANWISDNNRWMSSQSAEIFGVHGCAEHMSDKQLRHCRISIVENTPARVVVHWRYPSSDIGYQFMSPNHWTDEYHTIYPDGSGIRKVYWNGAGQTPGFEDNQYLTNPGETALDVMNLAAVTVANTNGETDELVWEKPNHNPQTDLDDGSIMYMNPKAEWNCYAIYPEGGIGTWGAEEQSEYTDDPFAGPWNHWPVNLVPSDGRFINAADRVSHFALGAGWGGQQATVYNGLTSEEPTSLTNRAKSWQNPASITSIDGAESKGFQQAENAYYIEAKEGSFSFTINASSENPIHNPCFIIRNWNSDAKASLSLNGNNLSEGTDFQCGVTRNSYGAQECVIWLEYESESEVEFNISGANPDKNPPTPDPMGWKEVPAFTEDSLTVSMTATTATDESGVEYFFECTTDSNYNVGWQRSSSCLIKNLGPNTEYSFRVKARDGNHNESDWSDTKSIITGAAPNASAIWNFDTGSGETLFEKNEQFNGTINGAEWVSGHSGSALKFDGDDYVLLENADQLSTSTNFSWVAWIKTSESGTIIARTGSGTTWAEGGRCFFVSPDGEMVLDIGWVGFVTSEQTVNDGKWHQVAITCEIRNGDDDVKFYIDGEYAGGGSIDVDSFSEQGLPFKIGYCNDDFPEDGSPGFIGRIDKIRWYNYVVTSGQLKELTAIEMDNRHGRLPDEMQLHQNYPNPFNPRSTIKFDLNKSSQVTIDIFNILGEKVKTVVEKNMKPGYHQVVFNASQLSSGVYYYRIKADDYIASKKCVLLK